MIKQHIEEKAGVGYIADYPHIKARLVAQMHIDGGTPIAEVAEHYGIPLADVYAAIAFYYDNQAAIEQARQDKIARAQAIGDTHFRQIDVSGKQSS